MNIGNSILPSSNPQILQVLTGIHGSFQVRVLPDLDTHGLFYARNSGKYQEFQLIAMHANGYSCHELAKRIITAWNDDTASGVGYAVDQARYILACGGMARSLETIQLIATGDY